MNRIDQFTSSILRFLQRRERETQHSLHPSGEQQTDSATVCGGSGEPQPGVRMLDSSEDIAIGYSADSSVRASDRLLRIGNEIGSSKSTAGERYPKASTAPETKWLLAELLELGCETVVDSNRYGALVCGLVPIGICKHCGLPICANCQKWESCTTQGQSRHELLQPEFATKVSA